MTPKGTHGRCLDLASLTKNPKILKYSNDRGKNNRSKLAGEELPRPKNKQTPRDVQRKQCPIKVVKNQFHNTISL